MPGRALAESNERDWLGPLFGPDVRFGMAPLTSTRDDLFDEERPLIQKVVSKREREVATGRALARRLLAELGQPAAAILRDDDKVPIWPEAVVGSITHKSRSRTVPPEEGRCIVALALAEKVGALGLDLEANEPIDPRLLGRIGSFEERKWVEDRKAEEAGGRVCRGRLLFSAKEAVYKAFFPRTRAFWGFHDVEVEFDLAHFRFRAQLPSSAAIREVEGRVAWQSDWILTVVEVPAGRF